MPSHRSSGMTGGHSSSWNDASHRQHPQTSATSDSAVPRGTESRHEFPVHSQHSAQMRTDSSSQSRDSRQQPQQQKQQSSRRGLGSCDSERETDVLSRPLMTSDILRDPRVQRVTGFLPRNLDTWRDRAVTEEEFDKVKWVLSLPNPWSGSGVPRRRLRQERLEQLEKL